MNKQAVKEMMTEMLLVRAGKKHIDFVDALNIAQELTERRPELKLNPRQFADRLMVLARAAG